MASRAPTRRFAFAALLLLIAACGSEPPHSRRNLDSAVSDSLRAQLLALATEALRARADVRVHGDVERALRERAHAAQFRDAMRRSLELAAYLHRVTTEGGTRYERHDLTIAAKTVCRAGETVRMLVELGYRFTFRQADVTRGAPPETAGTETHLFYFEPVHPLGRPAAPPTWVISYHHEVSLPEHHDRDAVRVLLEPCA